MKNINVFPFNFIFTLLTHNSLRLFSVRRYKCYVCEGDECQNDMMHDNICENALICYKSRIRESSGHVRVSRGCTKSHEHLPLYCSQSVSSNGHKKRDASSSGVYLIECCTGDFCNNGTFPYLAPMPSDVDIENVNGDPVKFFGAVFGCILIVITIASIVIFLMRKGHNKRLSDSRLQQDDAFFATEDLLKRPHACGDSTLRVSLK